MILFAMVATAVFIAVLKINLMINYVPVMATISRVSSSCKLEEVDYKKVVVRTTTYTNYMSCGAAEALKASGGPDYDGMDIDGSIDATFRYYSPADGSLQTGSLTYSYESFGGVAALKNGDHLPILAHKTDPRYVARDNGDAMDRFATEG